jgi:hypothetical protein
MIELKYGKSYIVIFIVTVAIAIIGAATACVSMIGFPIAIGAIVLAQCFTLVAQVRSDIALDSHWKASIRLSEQPEKYYYTVFINSVVPLALAVLGILFLIGKVRA